eukprot:3877710-Pyramimonas_sp.AAC.1
MAREPLPQVQGRGRGEGSRHPPARKPSSSLPPVVPAQSLPSLSMFSGRRWMDSYWEPKPTPGARRLGE